MPRSATGDLTPVLFLLGVLRGQCMSCGIPFVNAYARMIRSAVQQFLLQQSEKEDKQDFFPSRNQIYVEMVVCS